MPDTQAALAVDKPTDLQPGPQVALLAMQSSGGTIDVQMGMSQGELDMHTPHGYMLNWLAQNWPGLTTAAKSARHPRCRSQRPSWWTLRAVPSSNPFTSTNLSTNKEPHMASQNASSPASRDISKAAGLKSTKVAVPSSTKPTLGLGVRQPKVGKETANGGLAMGKEGKGDKGPGQMVKTVKSNPIAGSANVPGNTAMGNGAIKNGFV